MIEIRVIKDLAEAKAIWNELSPNETIYDLWDFRYPFYLSNPQEVRFYAAYDENRPVALLPLQYCVGPDILEFFAEDFMDNNRPFFAPGYEYLLPQLFEQNFGKSLKIYDLDGVDEYVKALPIEDYVYFINLAGLNSFDDYLKQAFPDRHKRENFKRLFTLLERDHDIKVIPNNFSDLELIMDLNVKRFGTDSYLNTTKERQAFHDLIKLPLDWRMTTVIVDGVKQAGSLAVVYKNIYYYLVVGSDLSQNPNVFKYLTKLNLESALASQAKIFNCSLGDCNWKSHWHMDKYPQYKFFKIIE